MDVQWIVEGFPIDFQWTLEGLAREYFFSGCWYDLRFLLDGASSENPHNVHWTSIENQIEFLPEPIEHLSEIVSKPFPHH